MRVNNVVNLDENLLLNVHTTAKIGASKSSRYIIVHSVKDGRTHGRKNELKNVPIAGIHTVLQERCKNEYSI